jgi:hypothetical protein
VSETDLPRRGRSNQIFIVAIAVLAFTIFTYEWWINPARPDGHNDTADSYVGYFDQSQYIKEANIVGHGRLPDENEYVYPLGYPVLAAPFTRLHVTNDPFFVVDALAFAGTMVLLYLTARHFRGSRFGFVAVLMCMFASPLLDYVTVPWSSTVSLLGAMAILYLVLCYREIRWWSAAVLGFIPAFAYATRPPDGLLLGLLSLLAIGKLAQPIYKTVAAALIPFVLVMSFTFYTQNRAFGSPFTTPYVLHTHVKDHYTDQSIHSFHARKILPTIWEMFLTGSEHGIRQKGQPLGHLFLWAFIPLPFAFFYFIRRRFKDSVRLSGALIASAIGVIFYSSFIGTEASDFIFGALHYYKMWIPLWALCSLLYLDHLYDRFVSAGERTRTSTSFNTRT